MNDNHCIKEHPCLKPTHGYMATLQRSLQDCSHDTQAARYIPGLQVPT
jgi:hypothetical protein